MMQQSYYFATPTTTSVLHSLPEWQQDWARAYTVVPFDRFGATPAPPNFLMHSRCAFQRRKRDLTPYGDIMDSRAAALLSTGQPLRVCWSGGIDSTAILVSLMRANAPKEQVTILLTEASKRENRPFYDRFIEDRFHTQIYEGAANELLNHEGFLVSGEGNDQLYGSDEMGSVVRRLGVDMLLRRTEEKLFSQVLNAALDIPQKSGVEIHRAVMRSAETVSVPIRRIFDAMWWMNFAFKWHHVSLRMLAYCKPELAPLITEAHERRLVHFFHTDEFQNWTCTQHEKKIIDRWPTYKITAKNYIYRFDQNEEFLAYGVKLPSLRVTLNERVFSIYVPFQLAERPELSEAAS